MSIQRPGGTISGLFAIGVLLSACNGGSVALAHGSMTTNWQSVSPSAKFEELAVGGYVSVPYVTLYNNKYQVIQTLLYGLIQPFSVWFDNKENVYVANINRGGCNGVYEFPPEGSAPIFEYTGESCAPFDVKTDKNQNVYVANNWGNAVIEYAQQNNTPIEYCNPLPSPSAVAIDSSNGNVFVAYYNTAPIAEFAGGLSGCSYTNLSPFGSLGWISSITGMLVDQKGNLVAVDGSHATVDIIPPPYTKIKAYIGRGVFKTPNQIALNERQDLLFVADNGLGKVFLVKYPSGKIMHKSISSPGVTSVAAYPSQQE
ncbi:MAG TPA: hypothetical protein VK755_16535 [Candidatus Acidoferrales bacterium]|jgi:hypothetical protein|nr:hypothetical protein [Candidatus Acidoferrales bacterium]